MIEARMKEKLSFLSNGNLNVIYDQTKMLITLLNHKTNILVRL